MGSSGMLIFYVAVTVIVVVVAWRLGWWGRSRPELKARGGGPGCIHCIGDFKLYPDRLETPHGTARFSDGPVTATVDTAGNLAVGRRATLTRMAAGGQGLERTRKSALLFPAIGYAIRLEGLNPQSPVEAQ